jgi:putative endonuclease
MNFSMKRQKEASDTWWLYCILCRGGGVYVGIAKDVAARYKVHCSGRGSFYTKLNRPEELIGCRPFPSRTDARKEEIPVKKFDPLQKLLYLKELRRSAATAVGSMTGC